MKAVIPLLALMITASAQASEISYSVDCRLSGNRILERDLGDEVEVISNDPLPKVLVSRIEGEWRSGKRVSKRSTNFVEEGQQDNWTWSPSLGEAAAFPIDNRTEPIRLGIGDLVKLQGDTATCAPSDRVPFMAVVSLPYSLAPHMTADGLHAKEWRSKRASFRAVTKLLGADSRAVGQVLGSSGKYKSPSSSEPWLGTTVILNSCLTTTPAASFSRIASFSNTSNPDGYPAYVLRYEIKFDCDFTLTR